MRKRYWASGALLLAHVGVACSSDTCGIQCSQPLPDASNPGPGGAPSTTATPSEASDAEASPTLPATSSTTSGGSSGSETSDTSATSTDAPVSSAEESSGSSASSAPSQATDAAEQDAGLDQATANQADAATSPDVVAPARPAERMTAHPTGSTDAGLGFWEYLPPGYEQGSSPLLVFTHGASWTGDGSEVALQEVLDVGPPNLIATDAWPNERPFVVLAPQNPGPGCFDPDDIDVFIRYAVDHYKIDEQRVYLTGQSCGAIGAWQYLAEHLDEVVAAAVLISGDGRDAVASAGCELGRVPLWGFHNENDSSVAATGTIEPINTLLACEPTPDVKLTIYPGETEHDAWTKTYDLSAGHDIYSWLLEHVRQ